VFFIGALLVAAAGALALLLAGSLGARAVSVILIAVTPVVLWLVPPATSWTQAAGQPLSVAIVQGNFPQDVKWDRDYFLPTLERYRRLTETTDAELVVWPEVAIPTLERYVRNYLDDIDALAADKDQTVLV